MERCSGEARICFEPKLLLTSRKLDIAKIARSKQSRFSGQLVRFRRLDRVSEGALDTRIVFFRDNNFDVNLEPSPPLLAVKGS